MKYNNFIKPLCLSALVLFAMGCTDLEVEPLDSKLIESEEGGFGGIDPGKGLETAYADLRAIGDQSNLYALSEVTSDELLVPTRGVDWGDNGVWRSLHLQNWNATHAQVLSTWNILNANVFRINQILHPASKATAEQVAQAKFLRAWNMFWIVDLWGKVPFREADQGIEIDPIVLDAQAALNDYILKDLNEALPQLPAVSPESAAAALMQANKAAAHFLLAKTYLNKHIFLGQAEADAGDLPMVIDNVSAIESMGFSLEDDYFGIFNRDLRDDNSELIFWTDAAPGNRIWNSLHYNQNSKTNNGGWNGFSTTADFYALFEGPAETNAPDQGQEERRGFVSPNGIGYGFLIGQQYGQDGQPLTDRSGKPLVFTPDFPNGLTGNNEVNGIRVIKYHPDITSFDGFYILMRYADALLMKAEAMARMGDMTGALELVNKLRESREATPLTSLTLMDILDERGRELYIEGWRRQDQIRFGTFTAEQALKPATEDFRRLFPIPATAITTNPNLEQNPGY